MSTLKYMYKVTRPDQSLLVGASAWLIALLSNGPDWFTSQKVAVAICMACSCMGASLFHYGRRADIYARKWYDKVDVTHPWLLQLCGGALFGCSLLIAATHLPAACFWVALANCIFIACYANFLDQYWPWKNIVIAFVCTTPIFAGWFSGHRLHPIVPSMICAIYCAYLAREILKDVVDREANHGKRFTMVMSIGITPSIRAAGSALLLSVGALLYALRNVTFSPLDYGAARSIGIYELVMLTCYTAAVCILFGFGWQLVRGQRRETAYRTIDVSMICLMLAVLTIRTGMYP